MNDRIFHVASNAELAAKPVVSMTQSATERADAASVRRLNDQVARDPRSAAGVLSFWLSRGN